MSEALRLHDEGALASLRRVTQEIIATIDLDRLMRVILSEAISFTHAEAGMALRLGERGVEGIYAQGLEADAVQVIQEFWIQEAQRAKADGAEDASETSSPHQVIDRHLLVRVLGEDRLERVADGAILAVPSFFETRVVGGLWLQTGAQDAFAPGVEAYLSVLADQLAVAIGNTLRYEEIVRRGELMHRRAEQMALLLEINRITRSDRPLEDLLSDVVYAVQEGTGFDVVLVSLLEGGYLRRVAGAGIPLAELEKHKSEQVRWERVRRLCQPRFQLGQCYYVPAAYRSLTADLDVVMTTGATLVDHPGAWDPEDLFFVPLRDRQGNVLGLMSLDSPRHGDRPDLVTAETVEVFAAQVARVIENHRLVENLRRQVSTLQLFNELNRSIATKLDLPLVLNTVVQAVTNVLDYDYATIYLKSADGLHFVPMACSGYSLDLMAAQILRVDHGFAGEVTRTGMPLVAEDVQADPRFSALRLAVGSSVVVPLVVEGRSVGILTADRRQRGPFTPAEVATMTALADQVVVAVENARLFEEIKRLNTELEARVAERTRELADALEHLRSQRDRAEVLYRIASELVADLDMDRVLNHSLSLLYRTVHATQGAVILIDHHTGGLRYRAVVGYTHPIPPSGAPAPLSPDKGVIGKVLADKTPLIIGDVLNELDLSTTGLEEDTRSVLAVPILGGAGEALGVLLFQSAMVDVFDESQLRLVEAAAVQLGNALNNADLYQMIREQAERLGGMLRAQQIEAAKNQAILEGIADGVMVADAEGQVILFNAAAERILSITRQQAIGRSQEEILGLYGSEAHEWLSHIEAWRDRPGNYGPEDFLAQRLEVDRRFVSVHLSPVASDTGEFLGVVSVFRDITAEIEADRAKSDFVSTVSHELRTPMTSIVGYVDLLLAGAAGALTEQQLAFLKRVKTNADRLTSLVNDLLDISRIDQGKVELSCGPVSVSDVVRQVLDLMQPRIEEKEQQVTVVIPDLAPRVYGDEVRLVQILTNLVSNAHKYTPVGGSIAIHAYVRQGMMHIAVADTGIGIAPENQRRIFERFYRVEDDPAVYEVSGTGLGLAIALSLIQMHGGDIWLESVVGKGSIFTFSIPLASGESTEDCGTVPPPLVTGSRRTVLVVEDDRDVAEVLRVTLEGESFEVLVASSGEQALRMAREHLPDLISLDIRLPDLDGWEVVQLLKRDPETADIPVVVVSVVPERERGMALGVFDYLPKPLDAQELLRVAWEALDQREAILVADADPEILNRVRVAMQQRGLRVRTTMRGERALYLAQDMRPAVVVLDLGLPDLDGYRVIRRLRHDQRTAHIPVVLTGSAALLKEKLGDEQGGLLQALEGVHIVRRPYSVDELIADVQALATHADI